MPTCHKNLVNDRPYAVGIFADIFQVIVVAEAYPNISGPAARTA